MFSAANYRNRKREAKYFEKVYANTYTVSTDSYAMLMSPKPSPESTCEQALCKEKAKKIARRGQEEESRQTFRTAVPRHPLCIYKILIQEWREH